MKIAVIAPNRPHFGNIMTQLPLLCGLKKIYPDAEITIWSKTPSHKLLLNCKAADKVVLYKDYSLIRLTSELRKERYDQIYNIYSGSEKVHLATALSGARKRFGFSDHKWLSAFYDHHMTLKKGDRYIAFNNLALLNEIENTHFRPNVIEQLKEGSGKEKTGKTITIVPGGGAGEYKRWDIKHYCATIQEVVKQRSDVKAVQFIIGPDERSFIDTIENQLPPSLVEIYDTPAIPELIRLASQSDLVIGNDCGPTHIFQMMESPLIMLWGWRSDTDSPFGTMCEWFYSHNNSWNLTPCENIRHINSIPVEKVSLLATAILSKKNHE